MLNVSEMLTQIFENKITRTNRGFVQLVRTPDFDSGNIGSSPVAPVPCQYDGIGRRNGLKIRCPYGRVGSTPTTGTALANVTQLARVSAFQAESCEFESRHSH